MQLLLGGVTCCASNLPLCHFVYRFDPGLDSWIFPLLQAAMGDPEYAFWNIHKWLYGPKSSALLYVRRDRQLLHVPAPAVVDNTETGAFTDRFIWTGTRDRTAYCGGGVRVDF
jgi:hypothetical protein